jgi:hypothetical protein
VQPLELLGPETLLPAPTFNLFTLLWVYDSTGSITIEGNQFDISKTVIYVVLPDQSVNATIQYPAKGMLISFSKAFLERFETPGRVVKLHSSTVLGFHPLYIFGRK